MDGVVRHGHHCVVRPNDATYDAKCFALAVEAAEKVDGWTSPNPWVGALVVAATGDHFAAATSLERGPHAEARALEAAGSAARGSTLYSTLEPCAHHGMNSPCVDAIIRSGVTRVVVGIVDPDARVQGKGVEQLRAAGIEVDFVDDALAARVERQLASYSHQRRTGRPLVVLKMAMTLDGRIAAPDGSSQWITGGPAREDTHRLRSRCDAIVVGAGTVRADNPSLTVRLDDVPEIRREPLRVVLGDIPPGSKVEPALSWKAELPGLLDHLGSLGHLQILVEGGGAVSAAFHNEGLIDRYVFYVAPALLGGDDGIAVMRGPGMASLADAWRGRFVDVAQLGEDVRITLESA